MFHHADSEDSDQTRQMPRLIWVFTGRNGHFVGFVMRQLKLQTVKTLIRLLIQEGSDLGYTIDQALSAQLLV